MRLLLAFLLVLSGAAKAGTVEIHEVCYQDTGTCVKGVVYNGFMSQMIMQQSLYQGFSKSALGEFAKRGITFQAVTPERYSSIPVVATAYISGLGSFLDELDNMSDEEFDAKINGLACYAATGGCIVGTGAAIVTAGSSLTLAAFSCVAAVPTCLVYRRALQKWEKAQQKKIEESKAKEGNAEGGGNGGGGGGGGGASTGGQGGWYGPGASVSSGGTVTITEAPPGPMPGAVGGGVGRRPILQ